MRYGGCLQLADAEDVVQEYFCTRWELLIRHFDPNKGSFMGFLREDFRRFLKKVMKRKGQVDKRDGLVSAETHEDSRIPGYRVVGAGLPILPPKEAGRKLPKQCKVEPCTVLLNCKTSGFSL